MPPEHNVTSRSAHQKASTGSSPRPGRGSFSSSGGPREARVYDGLELFLLFRLCLQLEEGFDQVDRQREHDHCGPLGGDLC